VLPIESPAFARAAQAVKEGFLAAAEVAHEKPTVLSFTHGDNGVVAAYEQAAGSGASVVVGPLVRDDVKQLLATRSRFPLTLALNQPEDGETLPRNFYTYALAIESEARQLAQMMRQDGLQRAAIIADTGALQRRLQAAFTQEWERRGGSVTGIYPYYSEPSAIRGTRAEIDKSDADCLLLALDNEQARQVRGYLSRRPAYASSLVYDGAQSMGYVELNNVRLVEMPWLAQPDHAAVMAYPRANLGDVALERLYALGIDAFRIAHQLSLGDAPGSVTLDGVTGRIFAAGGQRYGREGVVLVIRDGQMTAPEPAPPAQ
jgi:outer membrane PBP1 activator LpoA protein